jgi:hypothetical protein
MNARGPRLCGLPGAVDRGHHADESASDARDSVRRQVKSVELDCEAVGYGGADNVGTIKVLGNQESRTPVTVSAAIRLDFAPFRLSVGITTNPHFFPSSGEGDKKCGCGAECSIQEHCPG